MDSTARRNGLVPDLFYDDVVPMLEWYARVFGWQELERWEEGGKGS